MAKVNCEVINALINRYTLKWIKMASEQLDRESIQPNSPNQIFTFENPTINIQKRPIPLSEQS